MNSGVISTNVFKHWLLVSGLMLLVACQQMPANTIPPPPAIEPPLGSEAKPAACECSPPVTLSERVSPQPCPAIPAAVVKPRQYKPDLMNDLLVIGRVERVSILPGVRLKARIDTGAGISSLHAVDLIEFDRDGKPWVKFFIPLAKQEPVRVERPVKRYVDIKQLSGEAQRRPVVAMSIVLGSIEEQIEMTLADRTDYLYQVLVGRNFLRDRAIVDVSKRFTTKTPAK